MVSCAAIWTPRNREAAVDPSDRADLGDERYCDSRADAEEFDPPSFTEEIAALAARFEAAERVLDQLFAKAEVLLVKLSSRSANRAPSPESHVERRGNRRPARIACGWS